MKPRPLSIMKLLAVETATTRLSVAVMEGSRVLVRADTETSGRHAKYLISTIDELLKSQQLSLADVQGLAVSIGPGSFTGLRVGLATMLGFRMATGLPLAAVPTLEAMAWNLRPPRNASVAARSRPSGVQTDASVAATLCPILKARTGEVYWALYRWAGGTLTQMGSEQVGSLESMARSLNGADGSTVVYGEGWETHKAEFSRLFERMNVHVHEGPPEAMSASAVSVGLAGLDRLARGEVAGSVVSPRYVQRAEADIMMERRAAGAGIS
jgi:tRNA threonylcarbamoyladenosine biosynthesis protein TsaB